MRQLKTLVKWLVPPAIDAFGVYDRRLRAAIGTPDRWTIVMYHRVVRDPAADPFRLGMCVDLRRFEAQLQYLRSRFTILPVAEAVRRMRQGESLPPGALSVTFDDGYLDNIENAAPVLESLGIPWTLFVVTGDLDGSTMLWWDRVIASFAGTSKREVVTTDLGLSGPAQQLPLGLGRRAATVEDVLGRLWDMEHAIRAACIASIERALAPKLTEPLIARRLNRAQIQRLHARGVEIGAHSVIHPNLGLCDEGATMLEMQQSRSELEAIIQAPVKGFAYPGGRLVDATTAISEKCGFDYAMATDTGVNTATEGRFRLKRIGMPDTAMADFRRAFSCAMMRGAGGRSLTF